MRDELRIPPGVVQISPREFASFQELIYREAGIYLSPAKQPLLVGRLARRLRVLGINSFVDYYRLVETDEHERTTMLDCVCTNETHFFREKRHFDFIGTHVIPNWKALADAGIRPRCIRIWSAGCSTGEEPFSLGMFLLSYFADRNWTIEILGTDVSTLVLAKAESGTWPISKMAEIPEPLLKAYMLKGTGEHAGLMKAGPELRRCVSFARLNLIDDHCPIRGTFDLIFCCNVLIYFNAESKKRVLDRLIRHLGSEGYLFLGHAESLNGITDELTTVAPTICTTPSNAEQNHHGSRYRSRKAPPNNFHGASL